MTAIGVCLPEAGHVAHQFQAQAVRQAHVGQHQRVLAGLA